MLSDAEWAAGLVERLDLAEWTGPDLWACEHDGKPGNGRWGTCVLCPRHDGKAWPEHCVETERYDHQLSCSLCHGTGKRPPSREEAHRWRCTKVAAAVAREALASHNRALLETIFGPDGSRAALDAVDAWLACPGQDTAAQWLRRMTLVPDWVPGPLIETKAHELAQAVALGADIRRASLLVAEGWL